MSRGVNFIRGLAAAAIEPGLQRILSIGLTYEAMREAARGFSILLEAAHGSMPRSVLLPASAGEQDLWGQFLPSSQSADQAKSTAGLELVWRDGLLSQSRLGAASILLLVPDLSILSLSTIRSCIQFLEPDVVHLEREGMSGYWRPRIYWLASCAPHDLGRVSHHLLDRFLFRLPAMYTPRDLALEEQIKTQELLSASELHSASGELDSMVERVQRARYHWPEVDKEAVEQIAFSFDVSNMVGMRPTLALGLLSRAIARLELDSTVNSYHVDSAAALIGLRPKSHYGVSRDRPSTRRPSEDRDLPPDRRAPVTRTVPVEPTVPSDLPVSTDEEGILSDPSAYELPPIDPYIDRVTPATRPFNALRIPFRRSSSAKSSNGPIIGIKPAHGLADIALVQSLIRASFFQRVRRLNSPDAHARFHLSPADLREFRRLPLPEKMLVLVHDYTCLRDSLWQESLFPHLRWAYENRASVCLMKVGSKSNSDDLHAERLFVRSILTPALGQALENEPGRATPLAHALELARETIVQAQQRGRNRILHTRLVVLTDGRGNVPLSASLTGNAPSQVTREGIEDSQRVAEVLAKLTHVERFLLDPQPRQLSELPTLLASLLDASIEKIPLEPAAELAETI